MKYVGLYIDREAGTVDIFPMHDIERSHTIKGSEKEAIAWAIDNVKVPDTRPIREDEVAVVAWKTKYSHGR